MMSEATATATCSACNGTSAKIKNGKNGTMSIACPDCGTLALVKSPKAVASLRERIAAATAPPADDNKSKKKKSNGIGGLFGGDILGGL